MADQRITALTELSVPDLLDVLEIIDVSDATDDAAGSSRRVQIQRLLASVLPKAAEGRLTLTTGVPVTTSDVTAAGTLYYTPYLGNKLSGYDGTRWQLDTFAEQSLALTLTSGKLYDVFKITGGGLELSAAWTNDTTRADALATQDGVTIKSGAATRRWLGTIRASGANTTEDSLANRLVWNRYNQAPRSMQFSDTTPHNYTSATIRQWAGSTASQIAFVIGQAGAAVRGVANADFNTDGTSIPIAGAQLDDTTTFVTAFRVLCNMSAAGRIQAAAAGLFTPSLGYHFISLNEQCAAGGTATMQGGGLAFTIDC